MSRRLTTEEFIQKATEVHKGKYSYDKVVYVNFKTKVIITCPTHGDFFQNANSHLVGSGCSKCVGRYKLSKNEFIERSKTIWGNDAFDYSKCDYYGIDKDVLLVCGKHNIMFKQKPSVHLLGCCGCSECLYEKNGTHKKGYWTYERCYETAKKYEWLSDFSKHNSVCYVTSIKNSWLEDFTWLKRNGYIYFRLDGICLFYEPSFKVFLAHRIQLHWDYDKPYFGW